MFMNHEIHVDLSMAFNVPLKIFPNSMLFALHVALVYFTCWYTPTMMWVALDGFTVRG